MTEAEDRGPPEICDQSERDTVAEISFRCVLDVDS